MKLGKFQLPKAETCRNWENPTDWWNWFSAAGSQTTWVGFSFGLAVLELKISQNQRQLGTFSTGFRTLLSISRKLFGRCQSCWYRWTRYFTGYTAITCFSRFDNFSFFVDFLIPMSVRPSKFNIFETCVFAFYCLRNSSHLLEVIFYTNIVA